MDVDEITHCPFSHVQTWFAIRPCETDYVDRFMSMRGANKTVAFYVLRNGRWQRPIKSRLLFSGLQRHTYLHRRNISDVIMFRETNELFTKIADQLHFCDTISFPNLIVKTVHKSEFPHLIIYTLTHLKIEQASSFIEPTNTQPHVHIICN